MTERIGNARADDSSGGRTPRTGEIGTGEIGTAKSGAKRGE